MVAFTDVRKSCCFLDLHVPSSPTHSSSRGLPPGTPLLKKPKFTPPRALSHRAKPSTPQPKPQPPQKHKRLPGSQPEPQCFPPPAPLRRPVHGPQRIVRVFGLGPEVSAGVRVSVVSVGGEGGDLGMGNILAWCVRRASSDAPWSSPGKGEAPAETSADRWFRDGALEGLRLDDRGELVEDARWGRPSAVARRTSRETASGNTILPRSASPVVSDFTVPTRGGNELLEHAGRSPLQAHVVEGGRRAPVYKKLLLSARKRHSRLDRLELQVKLIEKRVSDFSKVSEVKPGEDLLGPFTPLTEEEENAVNLALRDPDKFCLCKYEVLVLHESSNIVITREVIRCLSQGSWLNDEVINLYFQLLKEREKREPEKFLKCHFFNTFFYKKLTSGKNSYDFKAVRRWTSPRKLGYGLIECNKIFVPIHREIHWCLAVIDVKNEKLLYLDSMGRKDDRVLKVLATYFEDEVKDKNKMTINTTSWKQEAVDYLPRQKNGWDCGMFMIKYADFISRGLSLCFHQDIMMYFRKRTAKEILRLRAE